MDTLDERIARLDEMIANREDGVRGLGIRLALGLGQERAAAELPGTRTAELVRGWMERFGAEVVEDAIQQARAFVADPGKLAQELSRRLQPPEDTNAA